MIKKLTLPVLVLLTGLFISATVKASHIPGGTITYECIGTNQFRLTLTLYEDCGTAFAGSGNVSIGIQNNCGFSSPTSVSLTNQIYQQEVSQLCPASIPNSECNNGTLPGIYMHQWQGTVTLPGQCNSWTFSYSLCCRNTSTNLVGQGTFFIETKLNSVTAPCNNSVQINAQPIPYVCASQNVYYSFGATDADGDSLSFAFIGARSNATTFIAYQTGFSAVAPIPGITLNPVTGLMTFNTSLIGNYVVAVLITEYDDNGNATGSVVQDFQFEVINCSNQTPVAPTQITNYTGDGTFIAPDKVNLCYGESCCFDLVFTDPDVVDQLVVDPFYTSLPPGCTYTVTGTNPLTVNVCLVAQPSSGAAYDIVSVTIKDNACPINALANFNVLLSSFSIEMSLSSVTPTCPGINDGSIVATADTAGYYDFSWYLLPDTTNTIQFNDNANTTANMNNLSPGTYLVYITDSSGQCAGQQLVTLPAVNEPFVTISAVNAACPGIPNGSITATANNGVGPWDYIWVNVANPSVILLNDQNISTPSSLTGIPAGTYQITFTSSAGCSSDTIITITSGVFTVNTTATNATCELAPNGVLTANTTNGTSPYDYVWANLLSPTVIIQNDQNITTTSTFTNMPGTYIVTYTDAAGCSSSDTLVIGFGNNPPPLNPASVVHETCYGFENGSISISAAGGQSPWDYVWVNTASPTVIINNDQNITVASDMTDLPSGTYQITVTDAWGCTNSVNVVVNQGTDVNFSYTAVPETCYEYADGSINIFNVSGGTSPFTYIIAGPENDTLTSSSFFADLTAGNYYGYVVDANGCVDSLAITVPAAIPVIASFTATPMIGNPPMVVTFTNNSTGATGYFWDFGDTTGSIVTNPTHTYNYENDYVVTLVATNGPCADTAYLTIVVVVSHIEFPNVFSPNGDGQNDVFHFNAKDIELLTCVIYNRWGLKIYEFKDPYDGWNGKDMDGKDCADGTYYYILNATGIDAKQYAHHGTVNLFRNK